MNYKTIPMKLKAFLWITILGMVFISCSGGDDESKFKISFEASEYNAAFYMQGETDPLTITSEIGEGEGDIDINTGPETHSSISYNGATGRVEWTRELPLGINNVTVVAILDTDEATTEFTINNSFQGLFDGGYNFNPGSEIVTSTNFEVDFNDDGTLNINDDGNAGTGTWERSEDNTIEFIYSYDIAPTTFYVFRGPLVYNEDQAYVEGFFYRNEIVLGNERGYFRVDM